MIKLKNISSHKKNIWSVILKPVNWLQSGFEEDYSFRHRLSMLVHDKERVGQIDPHRFPILIFEKLKIFE